jgi:phage terminase large subunit GpA-like protein
MLNAKCFHCGKSFALDMDLAAAWLEEHKEERPKHYPAQCHFCRRVIKMPVKQLRRYLPAKEDAKDTAE